MNARVLNDVTGRLSLRTPQAESLGKLAQAIAAAPDVFEKDRDVSSILSTLKAEFNFPNLDFERDFPSLCFALATGVGKTRLMGAFISYLYMAHGIENFFVLAPNLTIYDKLITDFTPNTPKYVFRGIAEFSSSPPEIITGDNYDQRNPSAGSFFPVKINIFNISKINSEVRGGREPRIKRMREVIGDSYFNYLAELPDLVLLMDESHRYRGSAGIRSINELKPLLGLELTATPFVEAGSGKTVAFKNVVVDYPLARAMDDGFVKEPAVVTRRNFDPKQYTPEQIEEIKLKDGIRLHEATKVELVTYARENNNTKLVKPFMLVIARDTTHAKQLMDLIQSDAFYGGRYKNHVIQVDSSKTGADEEEMIRRLLAVESVEEPTEIVIHVNMLKEGWDVTNLYTIVPLRAANARTLIEQSIGRGLRLPYGKRTGVDAVDRLNIVAHDKFQEIVDEANRADSPIRLRQLILDTQENETRTTSVQIQPTLHGLLGQTEAQLTTADSTPSATALQATGSYPGPSSKPLFTSAPERAVALEAMQVMEGFAHQPNIAANRQALLHPTMQQQIVTAVQERLAPAQQQLLPHENAVDIAAVVAKATAAMVAQTIDIPRIVVVPSGDVTTGFNRFSLDLNSFNLKPSEEEILGQGLRNAKQFSMSAESGAREDRLENYIVHSLIDFDDVDYDTHADLLYGLATQVVEHFKSQNFTEVEVQNILKSNQKLIANEIHSQMMQHFWEKATEYVITVNCGFTTLKPCNFNASEAEAKTPRSYRETVNEVGKIKQMLFGDFSKCLYPLQKFDSDTERRFGVILERDADKWFRPVKGQFQLYYRLGSEQPEYVPDFVVETADAILMCETKARTDMQDADVQAKAKAAATWCQNATVYSASHGGKPWHYLLIPHDDIAENKQLSFFMKYKIQS